MEASCQVSNRDSWIGTSLDVHHLTTATMRDSASRASAISHKSSGCSPQYEEYSRIEVPERMKEGAVKVDRSPVKVAMDFRKLPWSVSFGSRN